MVEDIACQIIYNLILFQFQLPEYKLPYRMPWCPRGKMPSSL